MLYACVGAYLSVSQLAIVGADHYRAMMLLPREQILYWHDPYGNGRVPVEIMQNMIRALPNWSIHSVAPTLQFDDCNCGFISIFIIEHFMQWYSGAYGTQPYHVFAQHLARSSRPTMGNELGR